MSTLFRWLAPVALAAGLGMAALTPTPAHAQNGDELARVIVDVADVIFRSGTPYYRHGRDRYDDRLIVVRDRYGRPTYYRQVPRHVQYRPAPRYYSRTAPRHVKCNKHGKCKVKGHYYDARYDRRYDDRYYSYDRRDRHHDERDRWHDRHDD
jgi:hypothetical protein